MTMRTRGLKVEAEVKSVSKKCLTCDGEGVVATEGIVETIKGPMNFFNDCHGCKGEGYMTGIIKRIPRAKRRGSCEIIP